MQSYFWHIFGIATALKVLLMPAYYSTDFEVHRNWLAITHSLPLQQWYVDATSEWTLDYPPFFAYFEWILSQLAQYFDKEMLNVNNQYYASQQTICFQRMSVIVVDIFYAIGVKRCLNALHNRSVNGNGHHFVGEFLLLLNVGLIFVDHIHFQYNGFLFGVLLLSISFLLERKYLLCAFTFSVLLNLKHIFLYIAPAFGVFILRFYILEHHNPKQIQLLNVIKSSLKVLGVGLLPFFLSFGPFWSQLPQVLQRLFPFKRGLTHSYWAPNFWAFYNTIDKAAAIGFRGKAAAGPTTSSGLVQEFNHVILPSITPATTFALTALFMLPALVKLFLSPSESTSTWKCNLIFLRTVVLCACSSFIFGWHVHEKAILMILIPLCLISLLDRNDAKYAFFLSVPGYYSLLPLIYPANLIVVRYSLYLAYVLTMYAQLVRLYNNKSQQPTMMLSLLEKLYIFGFTGLPIYEHILSPLLGLNRSLPFMPLLLTSLYASLGVLYFFINYYFYALTSNYSCSIDFPLASSKGSRNLQSINGKGLPSLSSVAKETKPNIRKQLKRFAINNSKNKY